MWRSAVAGRETRMRRQFFPNKCRSIMSGSINGQRDRKSGLEEVMSFIMANIKRPAWLLAVGIFSLCLTGTAMAQGKPAGVGPPPNNNPNLDDRARQVDQGRLRSAEANAGSEQQNEKLVQAAIVNMKEDFS